MYQIQCQFLLSSTTFFDTLLLAQSLEQSAMDGGMQVSVECEYGSRIYCTVGSIKNTTI